MSINATRSRSFSVTLSLLFLGDLQAADVEIASRAREHDVVVLVGSRRLHAGVGVAGRPEVLVLRQVEQSARLDRFTGPGIQIGDRPGLHRAILEDLFAGPVTPVI